MSPASPWGGRRAGVPGRAVTATVRSAAAWALAVLVVAALGVGVVGNHKVALGLAAAVLVVGLVAVDPLVVPVLALSGALLLQRVGGSGTNLSLSDLIVFCAAVVALTQVQWARARHLRSFLTVFVLYEAVLLVVVAYHPNRYDIVEWFHRISVVAGSLTIGWVIAAHGRVHQAVRLYLVAASVVALFTLEHAVTLHFAPAQWGVYQKNSIGAIMWVAIVVAQLNPKWIGLRTLEARIPQALCFGGLLASQSRQAIIVLIGALSLAYLIRSDVHRRSKLIFLTLAPLGVLAYLSFKTQFVVNPKFNTVSIRVDQLSMALKVWHLSPWLGEGMRFYNLPRFVGVPVPPNMIIGGLASTGVVGVVALVVFLVATLRIMARLPRAFGVLGLVVLTGHYVEGLFDIFWIGAYTAVPFAVVGLCLGMSDTSTDLDPLRGRPPPAGVAARPPARFPAWSPTGRR